MKKPQIKWTFLRKKDGHIYEIISYFGAVPILVSKMLKNDLWIFNSVALVKP